MFTLFIKLQVLKQTLEWIKCWESNLTKNLIEKDNFLTQNTADGLKITIASTIDAVNYLLKKKHFSYVLTSKFNQDCLEVMLLNFTKFHVLKYSIYEIILNYYNK